MERICLSTNASASRQKSSSLPNHAKLGVFRPFDGFDDSSGNVPVKTSDDRRDVRAADRNKSKNGRFNFFWKKKQQQRGGVSDSSSSSDSSSWDSVPRRGGLLPFARACVDGSRSNGNAVDGETKSNGVRDLSETSGPTVGTRLSQSSRDLRDTRRDALSAFDLFSSCKRSPSLRDSLDSLGRRGKRDAVKARVEAQREQYRDSSSDDEEQWHNIKKYHSDEALHKSSRERRLRVARTERFYKRKSRDDEWGRCEDRPPRSDRGRQSRNAHDSNGASPSPSPQPRGQTHSSDGRSRSPFHRPTEDFGPHDGTPSRGIRRYEASSPETVLSAHLPIKRIHVEGVVPRAPTPPPRSATKFHLVALNGGPRYGQRPQSYAFEGVPSLLRIGGEPLVEPETSNSRMLQNGISSVKTSSVSNARPSRPLSFTTTSRVIYNHTTPVAPEPSANGNVSSPQRHMVPESSMAYLSDSQISDKGKTARTWNDSKKSAHANFNSVPKPWKLGASGTSDVSAMPGSPAFEASTVTRPPPSPVRTNDSIAFFSVGGGTNFPPDPQEKDSRVRARIWSLPSETSVAAGPTGTESNRPNLYRIRTASPPPPPTRKHFWQQLPSTPPEAQKQTKSPKGGKVKVADHLEDAIIELEKIYQSMKNDDDAFLAEQNAWKARRNSTSGDVAWHHRRDVLTPLLSKTALVGSYDSLLGAADRPTSTSATVIDRAADDLAYRKLKRPTEATRAPPAYAGSYLMRSPALSPAMSVDDLPSKTPSDGPDTVLDDLSFRNLRDANLQKVIEPQPPFGIPLGPVTQAAATDYLHARAQDLSRPKMCRRFTPDVVKDDLAYRNLRRDKKSGGDKARPVSELAPSHLDFEELDTILGTDLQQTATSRKKFRAVRSLSANLSHLMARNGVGELTVAPPSSSLDGSDADKPPSLTDLSRVVDGNGPDAGDCRDTSETPAKATVAHLEENDTAQTAARKDTSSSTETLTEGLTHPGKPSTPVVGDIWQVRVTLGAIGSVGRRNSEDLGGKPVQFGDRRERKRHPLPKPIPVKLEVPGSSPGASLLHRTAPHFCYVSDSDAHSTRVRGSPIDERQLDDLLTSLAQGARSSSASVVTQRSISCPESPDDVALRSPHFPTVLTDDRTGEMFVKLVFPGLKVPGLKSASSATDETHETKESGERPNPIPSTQESAFETTKWLADKSYGVTNGRFKEMFPVTARTRNMVSSGTASDRPLQEKNVPSFNYRTVSPATNAAFIKDVKDGLKISERPPVMRKFPGNGPSHTPEDTRLFGGGTQDVSMPSHTDRMAKYKEERRKQLASQYGQWSSSEEGAHLGEEPSFMRYSRRYKKKVEAGDSNHVSNAAQVSSPEKRPSDSGTSGAPVVSGKPQSVVDATVGEASSKPLGDSPTKSVDGASSPVEGMVRMNRASRLRAKANGAANSDGVGITTEFSRQGSFRSKLPLSTRLETSVITQKTSSTPDALLGRWSSLNQGVLPNASPSCDVSSSYGATDQQHFTTESEGGTGSDAHGRPKDKSAKRKSNLNRMGAVESTPLPSDSGDETPRRFRRSRPCHGESSAASADSAQSDSLKSVSIVQSIQHQLSSSSFQSRLRPKDDTSFVKRGPSSTADGRFKSNDPVADSDTPDSDFERAGSFRRSGRTALRRPEIPDIFRQKAANASPQTPKKAKNGEDASPSTSAHLPFKPYRTRREPEASLTERADKFWSPPEEERRSFATKAAGVDRWEPTKIPIRKTTLSKLGVTSHDESHTLKISVEHASNGKADDVSDTLKELTKLVRETTAKVDCLTDAARRVDVGAATVAKASMGGKLFKEAAVPVEAENGGTDVAVDASFQATEAPRNGAVENGAGPKRISGSIATDGNWQLRHVPNENAGESRDDAFSSHRPKPDGSSDRVPEAPNDDEVKVPNRIATAYHTGRDLPYGPIGLDNRSPGYSAYNFTIPLSPLAWKKMNELTKQNAELSSLGIAELVASTVEGPASDTVPSDTGVVDDSPPASSSSSVPSILKKTSFDEGEIPTKSILKHKEDPRLVEGRPPVPHSILKRGSTEDSTGRSHSPEKSSILKKRGSSEDSDHRCSSPEVVSILRRRSAEEAEDHFLVDRHSILRRKSMLDEAEHGPSSILKKQCSVDALETVHVLEPRPILKKKNSSTEELEQSEPKPILKKRSSTEEEWDEKPKPILKTRRRSGQEDAVDSEGSDVGEMRRVIRVKAASPVLRIRNSDDLLTSSPPTRATLNVRHPTTSSEDDEFLSLPASPVNWKIRKDSDEDHSLGVVGRPIKTRVVIGSPSSLPSVICDVGGSHEEDDDDGAVSKSPELQLRDEATGAAVDSSEDEDDTESSSTSSSEEEDVAEEPATPATAEASVDERGQSVSPSRRRPPSEDSARLGSVLVPLSSIRGAPTENDDAKGVVEIAKDRPEREKVVETADVGPVESGGSDRKKGDSSEEDEVVILSVAERASRLMQRIQQQQQTPRSTAVRRFANRRNLQRSQTQPVTVEEVQEAAKMAETSARRRRDVDDPGPAEASKRTEAEDALLPPKSDQTSESDDDPSKLSLAERVKLFNQKMLQERLPAARLSGNGAETPRRRRVVSTRFCTQPVTTEEVEKAQRISPLTTSVVQPPEVFRTLPAGAACDLMHRCGEEMLALKVAAAASSRSASSSAIAARSDDSDDSKPKGILKKRDESQAIQLEFGRKVSENNKMTTVTHSCFSSRTTETRMTGILKNDKVPSSGEPKPILHESSSARQPPTTSSSSSSDEEEETEGITISVRDASPVGIPPIEAATAGVDDDSSSSLSQSGASGPGKETRRIKNEAVMRRRNAMLRKMEERKLADLQHSQSLNVASSFVCQSEAVATVLAGHSVGRMTQRSSTQPLTQMEKRSFEGVVEEVRGSIAERLAALQVSQQENWKRRLERTKSDDFEGEIRQISSESESIQNEDDSSSRILKKVSLLEVSQQSWRKRVEEKDAAKFTVAGKMGKLSPPEASPLVERKKRTPKPVRFQSRTANLAELVANAPASPLSPANLPIAKSKSMPMPQTKNDLTDAVDSITKVTVPRFADEGFSSFFESANVTKLQSEKVEVKEEAFNAIASESRQLLVQKRSVHVVRHHVGARNPLKTLAARQDLQDEYTEVKMGVAEREMKRIKVEQLAKHSNLATSALAGLASTEDFKAVSLRKSSSMLNTQLLPYKDLMLILVKGRRHVQCRLVEPCITSLNQGDNFILVTPNEVYLYVGEFSNVIERAKGAEVAGVINTKRDLGYKGSGELIIFDEEKRTGGRGKRRDFFQHLGGEDAIAEPGSPEEDEIYEASIVATNKVYEVEENELVPYEKYWGCIPRIEMLEKTKALVFDFGSEMYVWQGKLASSDLRKRAVRLAQELYADGYDYTDCDINPLNPYRNKAVLSFNKQRPPWALFGKVNQHMETVLFRSKFLDWPDMDQIIKIKRQDSECRSDGSPDLQPCDVETMLNTKPSDPDLVLENSHLGRGTCFYDSEERRHYEIATLGIKVWHVLEYKHSILPLESWGQFYSGDTYVVRWQYRVTVIGRDLSGQVSKHSFLGRERCAYFFWQGKHSTINEKGASALMTVELDEERGPHVRVVQGQEPPCFLNFFKGSMTVHLGKRETENQLDKWRLFIVRGELENETHLVEVACKNTSLRSGAAFVLINCGECLVFLWFGAKIQGHVKDIARDAVDIITERKPLEFGFKIGVPVTLKEEVQGLESDAFFTGIGGAYSSDFASVLKSQVVLTCTPRLFYLSSVSGVFSAAEVVCSYNSSDKICPYPFHQSELYKVPQPALFLLDYDHEVYLWQGWWPEATDDNDNMSTGSAHLRWNVERRLAMETVIQYCSAKNPEKPSEAYAVWAGLEPVEFKHLFSEWDEREDVSEINSKEGKVASEKKLVKDVLVHLKRTRYTFAELQERPLPEGVDPSIMESYLTSEEFEDVLKMSKKDFYALPSWKQFNLKKTTGLY